MKQLQKFVQLFGPLLLLVSSLPSWAAGGSDLGILGDTKEEFLPVEQAYIPDVIVEEDRLVINWIIAQGYYLYQDKFKFNAIADEGSQKLQANFEPGIEKYDEYFEKDVVTYYDTTQVIIPLDQQPGHFELKMRSQGCADAGLCYAPRTQYFQIDRANKTATEVEASQFGASSNSNSGNNSASAGANNAANSSNPEPKYSVFVYLLLAMGGGLILNLMPCVFPVLSLKALTFASTSGSDHSHHMHGWAYTVGVIGSFLVVALIILTARAAGESAGWGFQLQSPMFVAAMTYLFLIMGLSLSGTIHFGTSLMGVGQGLTANEGLRGSFFTGVLAAVVASPCTGPMMAPALGFALTQPAIVSLSIFVALGFGMALPFLLLSYSPKLANLLPRPGVWMEKLKEFLAFPMYLTAAWLLFVFGRQVGMIGVFCLVLGAIAIAFAIWLFQNQPEHRSWKRIVQGAGFASLMFAAYVIYVGEDFRNTTSEWQVFSPEKVEELRAEGHPVLVDFTADWCITCKFNKSVAFSGKGFKDAVVKHNVALVQADWTNENPMITKVLNDFNRSGVPLYLVYPSNSEALPEVLPQILTEDMVIEALTRAANGSLAQQ